MEKWEYKIIDVSPDGLNWPSVETKLNELGNLGWETVGIAADDNLNYAEIILKRRKN